MLTGLEAEEAGSVVADERDIVHQIEYRWHPVRDMSPFASSLSPPELRAWTSWIGPWVRHPFSEELRESFRYQVQPAGNAALAWRYGDLPVGTRVDGRRGRPLVSRVLAGPASVLTPEVAVTLCRSGLPASAGPRAGQVADGDELPLVRGSELSVLASGQADRLDEEAAPQVGLPRLVAAALSEPRTPVVIWVPPEPILRPPHEGVQYPLLWGLRRITGPLLGATGRGWSFSTFEPPPGDVDPATLPDIIFRQIQKAAGPQVPTRQEIRVRPFDPGPLQPDGRYGQLAIWLVAEYQALGGDELSRLLTEWCGAEQSPSSRLDRIYSVLHARWSLPELAYEREPGPPWTLAASANAARTAPDEPAAPPSQPGRGGHAFISYVREDSVYVDDLQRRLEKAGVRVWRDTANLWPGEDWRRMIRRAIQEDALVFIACFSQWSLARKSGFQNEELTWAIEQLRRRLPDDPWLIPVRLSDCDIPDLDIGADRTLRSIQRADLFGERSEEGAARLVTAVLRILGADQPPATAATGSQATHGQILPGAEDPAAEAGRLLDAAPEEARAAAVARVLARQDQAAATALIARWEAVAADVTRLLREKVAGGDISVADWCLRALHTANCADAEDRLLSRLLEPADQVPGRAPGQPVSALVSLLKRRPVPSPGTYQVTRDELKSGDNMGWQACLVGDLLERETATVVGMPRAVGWVNWLCRPGPAGPQAKAAWLAALSVVLREPASDRSVEGLRLLLRTDAHWAIAILRLAHQAGCLPDVLRLADLSLVDLAARAFRSPASFELGQARALLDALAFDGWREGGEPASLAAVDVVRVLLGGHPASLPGSLASEYVSGLDRALALEVLEPLQFPAGQLILASAYGHYQGSSDGIRLLDLWAAHETLRPSLVDLIERLPNYERPLDPRLGRSYWEVFSGHPWLTGYASVGRLLVAASAAVQRPDIAFLREMRDTGVTATELALACYYARLSGLSVSEILRALAHAGVDQLSPRDLDNTLREFQGLLYHADEEAMSKAAKTAPEQDLFECYELIVHDDALGDAYGLAFAEYITARLDEEIALRRDLRRRLTAKRRHSFLPAAAGTKARKIAPPPSGPPVAGPDSGEPR